MANIKYDVTRWDCSVVHDSHPTSAGCIDSVILGVTATDQVSGKSAYMDERISVPHEELATFEAGAEAWIEGQLGSKGWYLDLQTRIASQLSAPVPAPDRDKPNFAAMTVGDGYADFPLTEESTEEVTEDEEESVATEETTEESEAEESTEEATEEVPAE